MVSVYSVWPYFACMAVLLLFVSSPLFRWADIPPNEVANRVSTLDGLRGFLALAVFFHHGAVYDLYLRTGSWDLGFSLFFSMLGEGGVAVFFMITGYLFWGKMLKECGRPRWLALYLGRFFRIAPLYVLAIACMLLLIAFRTHFTLAVPPIDLAVQIGRWLLLGVGGYVDVNGFPDSWTILFGVTWTLKYEWLFYGSLIVAGQAARGRALGRAFPIVGLAVCLILLALTPVEQAGSIWRLSNLSVFLVGSSTASLLHMNRHPRLGNAASSAIVLLLLGVAFCFYGDLHKAVPIILFGAAFFLIASGADIFGLLVSRPAKRLGDVSYGIYLLQGPVLTLLLSPPWIRRVTLNSPEAHWLILLLSAGLLAALATVTHALVERPGINLGRRVVTLLGASPQRPRAFEITPSFWPLASMLRRPAGLSDRSGRRLTRIPASPRARHADSEAPAGGGG